jgi:hypothetical protein
MIRFVLNIELPKQSTMKALKTMIFLGVLVMLMSSCGPSLSYFTQDLYEQNYWTEAELKRIQFYLSKSIVLRRELSGSKSEIISGEIKLVDGRKVEEVIIPQGTPGAVVLIPKSDRLAVSFDAKDESYLIFGPNPKFNNRYGLMASEWKRRSGIVTFEGRKWRVENESAYAALMVDLKKVNKVSVDSRRATGRRVN